MQRTYHFAMAARSTLSPHELVQLTARARVRDFADGQFVQHQGDPGDVFWAVVDGHVAIGRFAEDGGFTHFGVMGRGDLFGELAFFTGVPRQVDALASGSARLVAIDRPLLRQLMAADVGWAELLLRSLSRQLAATLDIIDSERRLSTPDRLLAMLRAMAADSVGGDRITATQQQLADLLGVSRVTLGAGLRALAAQGLIERGYGSIRLTDPDGGGFI